MRYSQRGTIGDSRRQYLCAKEVEASAGDQLLNSVEKLTHNLGVEVAFVVLKPWRILRIGKQWKCYVRSVQCAVHIMQFANAKCTVYCALCTLQ